MVKKSTLKKIANFMGVGGTAQKIIKRDRSNTRAVRRITKRKR